jgi:hypothetical protein
MQHTLHHDSTLLQLLAAGGVVILLSACGDLGMRWRHVSNSTDPITKTRTLGIVHLGDSTADHGVDLRLVKQRGGYGMETPLYESENTHVNLVAMKNRDYQYFSGIQMHVDF